MKMQSITGCWVLLGMQKMLPYSSHLSLISVQNASVGLYIYQTAV